MMKLMKESSYKSESKCSKCHYLVMHACLNLDLSSARVLAWHVYCGTASYQYPQGVSGRNNHAITCPVYPMNTQPNFPDLTSDVFHQFLLHLHESDDPLPNADQHPSQYVYETCHGEQGCHLQTPCQTKLHVVKFSSLHGYLPNRQVLFSIMLLIFVLHS